MNHSVILPNLIRCQGKTISDQKKPEEKGTPQNPVKPSGANEILRSSCELRCFLNVLYLKITLYIRFIFYMHHSTLSHLEYRNLPLEKINIYFKWFPWLHGILGTSINSTLWRWCWIPSLNNEWDKQRERKTWTSRYRDFSSPREREN